MKLLNIIFLSIVFYSPLYAQTAQEIIQKAEDKMRSGSLYAEMSITTVRPKWSRTMSMKTWSKGTDFSIVLITAPAKEKGTVFLKRYKEAWNWVPSIQRSIKLPPSMMSQSWMGTDFTNEDMIQESSNVRDYKHNILKDEIVAGRKVWKIELIPYEETAVVWGKVIVYIDKVDYIQLRTEMYDEDGYLVNTMKASNIKEMGGKLLATKMEMIPEDKAGHKTILEYSKIQFDQPIEEQFFSVQNMKRLK
ncbi:MAG: outer membrane lipoprotein-sorting protein [Flavobacteriales bacterium]|jgi:outer membrane lipoprotein-sorting protein|nr:outer membrane lipoprotein-sorting protein [Flavobacteriales bacterium]